MRRCELGKAYPIRLSPLLQYEHKDREPALFTRKYPVTTLILMFFLFCVPSAGAGRSCCIW